MDRAGLAGRGRSGAAVNPARETGGRWVLAWLMGLPAAVAFLLAGSLKVWDPLAFAGQLFAYRLLPPAAVAPVALALPWIEVLAALALLAVPRWRRAGALLIAGMLLAFIAAEISVMARGLAIPCGCFGMLWGETRVGIPTSARNVALLASAALAGWFGVPRQA